MKVKQQQVCVGWERENEHVHCQNFCRNCRGKKSSCKWRFLLSSPRGKFLLLFLVFPTFPSFIPFSDLVLLFPLSPRMPLLLPQRELLSAGPERGWRGALQVSGAAGAAGEPGAGAACAGPVARLPRDSVGMKPPPVALGAFYTCLAQGCGGRGGEMANVLAGEDGGCEPPVSAPLGLHGLPRGLFGTCSHHRLTNAGFNEEPSARPAWPLPQADNHQVPHRCGKGLFRLLLAEIVCRTRTLGHYRRSAAAMRARP